MVEHIPNLQHGCTTLKVEFGYSEAGEVLCIDDHVVPVHKVQSAVHNTAASPNQDADQLGITTTSSPVRIPPRRLQAPSAPCRCQATAVQPCCCQAAAVQQPLRAALFLSVTSLLCSSL
ncbi:hypothetical protein M0R45_009434 [Rubus argutus]|uniref:Uncharacterized protein n=1 Tax=Rubus argutus TaxID=59490 RepID=A0AAW1Y4F4_RUBAR